MKTRIIISALCIAYCSVFAGALKDSTGMPGDNLDLQAVLGIFKDSKDVGDFEKKLNSADTKVNNLDLNNDGKVDYLRVKDYGKDNFHSLVIQDAVSSSETQDVAVIEVEKKGSNDAHLQIVGDEVLYGKNYVIEPATKKQVQQNNSDDVYASPPQYQSTVYVNVWAWPCVSYMYSPAYVFWASPWYFGYYPSWWYPWSPYPYYAYYDNVIVYHTNYNYGWRRSNVNNMPGPHQVYAPHRSYSTYVQKTNVQPVQQRHLDPFHPSRSIHTNSTRQAPQQKPGPPIRQAPFKHGQSQQQAPQMKEGPSLRYGPTSTGGVRGGGGTLNGGGGMRRR